MSGRTGCRLRRWFVRRWRRRWRRFQGQRNHRWCRRRRLLRRGRRCRCRRWLGRWFRGRRRLFGTGLLFGWGGRLLLRCSGRGLRFGWQHDQFDRPGLRFRNQGARDQQQADQHRGVQSDGQSKAPRKRDRGGPRSDCLDAYRLIQRSSPSQSPFCQNRAVYVRRAGSGDGKVTRQGTTVSPSRVAEAAGE
jgi:hypothetical protein